MAALPPGGSCPAGLNPHVLFRKPAVSVGESLEQDDVQQSSFQRRGGSVASKTSRRSRKTGLQRQTQRRDHAHSSRVRLSHSRASVLSAHIWSSRCGHPQGGMFSCSLAGPVPSERLVQPELGSGGKIASGMTNGFDFKQAGFQTRKGWIMTAPATRISQAGSGLT